MLDAIEKIDIQLFFLINRGGQNDVFDWFMPFMSDLSNFYIPLTIFWLFLVLKKNVTYRTVAVAILILISLSEWLSTDVLKPAVNRPRPFHSQSHVHLYDRMSKTWQVTPVLASTIRNESHAMPSSHATNIFAAAVFLSAFLKRSWPLFYLIAVLVGYSRVYLGVHYPFDVVCGAIAGTVCGLLLIWSCRHIIGIIESKRTG